MGVLDEELASEEEAFARAAQRRSRLARMEAVGGFRTEDQN